jgi:hypothetical protein
MPHEIRPGQVYVSCRPGDDRRIRVDEVHPPLFPGASATRVTVSNVDGLPKPREIWSDKLHPTDTKSNEQPRRSEYALETP